MKTKVKIDFIIAIILIVCSSFILLMPILDISNIKMALYIIFGVYAIANLIQFILSYKSKDYEGLYTFFASLIAFIMTINMDLSKPFPLALIIMLWVFMMSLIKLKKADYYHDRQNLIWIIRIAFLIIFILIGLLTTINLYYQSEVQILLVGNFYFIHGVLELIDPLVNHLMESK